MICKKCLNYDEKSNKCMQYGKPIECNPEEDNSCFIPKERRKFIIEASCSNCINYETIDERCVLTDEFTNNRFYCEKYEPKFNIKYEILCSIEELLK